ncbi:MAG TPA: hypothetical protein VGE26_10565 [Sphingobacteriaceae bacterium]
MKIKQITTPSLIIAAALFWISCASQKNIAPPQAPSIKVAQYDYNPPEAEKAKSAQVVFLLVDPSYQEKFKYSNYKLFGDFSKAMTADFNEALTAKGYSVRGPYEYYDQVVYNDKKESDLLLSIEIDFDLNSQNIKWYDHRYHMSGSGRRALYGTRYTYDGFFVLSGKANLVVSEPLTKEKLWAKSIPLKQREIPVKTYYFQDKKFDFQGSLTADPNIMNPITESLEDYYKHVFNTAWNHLDPNELTPLKKEVLEIREKKKY